MAINTDSIDILIPQVRFLNNGKYGWHLLTDDDGALPWILPSSTVFQLEKRSASCPPMNDVQVKTVLTLEGSSYEWNLIFNRIRSGGFYNVIYPSDSAEARELQ